MRTSQIARSPYIVAPGIAVGALLAVFTRFDVKPFVVAASSGVVAVASVVLTAVALRVREWFARLGSGLTRLERQAARRHSG